MNTKENTPETFSASKEMQNKMIKAISKAKQRTERIVGFIDFDFEYVHAQYHGTAIYPQKLTALEKGVTGILIVDEKKDVKGIGSLLGLDVVRDVAEEEILNKTINKLKTLHAIDETEDDEYTLTEEGRLYAQEGEYPESYKPQIDLYINPTHPNWLKLNDAIGENKTEYKDAYNPEFEQGLEEIRLYTAAQHPNIHCPEKKRFLKDAQFSKCDKKFCKVYIGFVQSRKNSDDVKAYVFNEGRNIPNEIFTEYINDDTNLKMTLLENCIHVDCQKHSETTSLIKEKDLVEEKSKIEECIIEAEKSILMDEDSQVIPEKYARLHKKSIYDTYSFELEIQNMFTNDDADEIWLISPWIRSEAFIDERGPMIEKLLQNTKKRVFVASSIPSLEQLRNPMVDSKSEKYLKSLEARYSNFFYTTLPEFHVKNVIEVKGEQTILFTGSFNVLSFHLKKSNEHIRKEEMALANHQIAKKKHEEAQTIFAQNYEKVIKEQIENLTDAEILNYKKDRLEYFLSINSETVKHMYLPIKKVLHEKKVIAQMKKELTDILNILSKSIPEGGLFIKEKEKVEKRLQKVKEERKVENITDESISSQFNNAFTILAKTPTKQISSKRGKQSNLKREQKQRI